MMSSEALSQMPGDVFSGGRDYRIEEKPSKREAARSRGRLERVDTIPSNSRSSDDFKSKTVIPSYQHETVQNSGLKLSEISEVISRSITALGDSGRRLYKIFSQRFQSGFWPIAFQVFRIPEVKLRGNSYASSEDILSKTGLDGGFWVWSISTAEVIERIKDQPWVKSVEADYSIYPLSLTMQIREREPWLTAEFEKGVWVIDEKGELICPLAEIHDIDLLKRVSILPMLRGLEYLTENGSKGYLNSNNARYLHAVRSLGYVQRSGELSHRIESASLQPDGSLILSPVQPNIPRVRLSATSLEKTRQSLSVLPALFRDLRERNEKTSLIDLRFGDRVVVR